MSWLIGTKTCKGRHSPPDSRAASRLADSDGLHLDRAESVRSAACGDFPRFPVTGYE